MERRVLGRGLAALIPERQKKSSETRVEYLKVDEIKRSKHQPREDFNSEKLNELTISIKEKGVIQPILVRPCEDGYELIAGERRLMAVRSLGLDQVPALVKEAGDADAISLALIENIQREQLNPIEEAKAYGRLMDEFGYDQTRIGRVVGKANTTISNSIRLLGLPEKIQDYLAKGSLTVTHAKVILSLKSPAAQLELAEKVIKDKMAVRSLDLAIKRKKPFGRSTAIDYDLLAIQERLQRILGAKVVIIKGKKVGKIEIDYYSNADLERILKIISKEFDTE